MTYRLPILGFDETTKLPDDYRSAVCGRILGPAMFPEEWARQSEAQQEVRRAHREELRILRENVIYLDDYRRTE
jgi:hypothetical protein